MSYSITEKKLRKIQKAHGRKLFYPQASATLTLASPVLHESKTSWILCTPRLVDFFSSQTILDDYVRRLKRTGATNLWPEILVFDEDNMPKGANALTLCITATKQTVMLDVLAAEMATQAQRIVVLELVPSSENPGSEIVSDTTELEDVKWKSEVEVNDEQGNSLINAAIRATSIPSGYSNVLVLATLIDLSYSPKVRVAESYCWVAPAENLDVRDCKITMPHENWHLGRISNVLHTWEFRLTLTWIWFDYSTSATFTTPRIRTGSSSRSIFPAPAPYTSHEIGGLSGGVGETLWEIRHEKLLNFGEKERRHVRIEHQAEISYWPGKAADHVDLVFNVLTQAHVGLTPFAANNRSVLVMHKLPIVDSLKNSTGSSTSTTMTVATSPATDFNLSSERSVLFDEFVPISEKYRATAVQRMASRIKPAQKMQEAVLGKAAAELRHEGRRGHTLAAALISRKERW